MVKLGSNIDNIIWNIMVKHSGVRVIFLFKGWGGGVNIPRSKKKIFGTKGGGGLPLSPPNIFFSEGGKVELSTPPPHPPYVRNWCNNILTQNNF